MNFVAWLKKILQQPWVAVVRRVLGECAVGAAMAWVLLMVWELIRPGAVSPFIPLHWLLVFMGACWLVGRPSGVLGHTYASVALSAILVGALGAHLGGDWPWLGVVAALVLGILWLGWPGATPAPPEHNTL